MKHNLILFALFMLSRQSWASQQPVSNDSSFSVESKRTSDVCSTVMGCNYLLQSLMSEYKKVKDHNEELLKENAALKKDKESSSAQPQAPVAKQTEIYGDDPIVMFSGHRRRSHGDETPEQRKERKNREGHTVY